MKNISNFNGETVTASHILVDTKGNEGARGIGQGKGKD